MNFSKTSLLRPFFFLFWLSLKGHYFMVRGFEVVFLIENSEVFEKCEGKPGNGIHDLFDMSNLEIEVEDYSMHAAGFVELVWDVQPTDRVTFRLEIFKYQRGNWQPTVFTVIKNNFCAVMFSSNEIWYDTLTSKIKEDDRECLNVKGTVYNLEPLDKFLTFQTTKSTDLEGRHKLVFQFEAYDEKTGKRPNVVCAEIKGEFEKLKLK